MAEGTGKQGHTLVIPEQGRRNGCHRAHPDVSLFRLQLWGLFPWELRTAKRPEPAKE